MKRLLLLAGALAATAVVVLPAGATPETTRSSEPVHNDIDEDFDSTLDMNAPLLVKVNS